MRKGMLIITDFGVFKIDKMYNENVWRLKNNLNEYINVFYSLEENYIALTAHH